MSRHAAITERSMTQRGLVVETTDDYHIVRGVRVLNEVSKNGGTYSRRARESAARMCSRLPLAIEHTNANGDRHYLDRVGQLREGRLTPEGAVDADMWINRGHQSSQQIVTDAKHFPENINLSVELPPDGWIGEDKRHMGGGYVVEDITRMDDVSIVARGGTTNTLYEGHRPKVEPDEDDMSTATTPAVNTQAVTEAVRSQLAEADERRRVQETVDRLTRERDDAKAVAAKLQEQVNAFQATEARRAKAIKIIEQAKTLNAGEISVGYAETLAKLDDTEIETTLKERAQMLARAGNTQAPASTGHNFNAPSVGAVGTDNTPSPFSWLK